MFQRLKTKTQKTSIFQDRPQPNVFSKSPGATSSVTKANEASRLVRCKHCGWICDRERDVRLKDGSYAGLGVNNGSQRIGKSYVHYYGSKKVDAVNLLKNEGFTLWSAGLDQEPDYWNLVYVGDGSARIETEDETYGMIQITPAEPD